VLNRQQPARPPKAGFMVVVATAQLLGRSSIDLNVVRICLAIEDAASRGAELVLCPECAVTGYTVAAIKAFKEEDMDSAWGKIMDACKKCELRIVIGPHY